MLQGRGYFRLFTVALSLLVISGCAKIVEIPNLQTESAASMPRAEAVAYLNSAKLTNFEQLQNLCNFNRLNVDFIRPYEEEVAQSGAYDYLTVTRLAVWTGTGKTGLWVHYNNPNPVVSFFEIAGCKVLGRDATEEQMTSAAEALIALGASYEKP